MLTFYSRRNTAGLVVLMMFLLSGVLNYFDQGGAAQAGAPSGEGDMRLAARP